MAVFKCKMCGGDLEVNGMMTVGTCIYCGSVMTLPKVSDERKANLFNRANHFRRMNDFDKAVSAYESILNEDNSDAEAHWGVVLSRYGIEYVEDPRSHERIPTCHRVQMESVLNDADYLSALTNALDSTSKSLYEAEAKTISDIQRGILAISSKEEPFDVFICYKETSETGSRTKDSAFAQDIYHQLTQEGIKVFFARITLEDKIGREYEPYIFAALNSAKVMTIVGTKPDYLTSPWVKNEWSRYLALWKKDRNRLVIPCYKDMDAYDLPEELSVFQSQDMNKIGFLQDLIRGIKKVIDGNRASVSKRSESSNKTADNNTSAMVKRAFLFLEDGDWQTAEDYCEKVLDIDPENSQAYMAKFMAGLKFKTDQSFSLYGKPIETELLYQKALRFADDEYKTKIMGYNEAVISRIEKNKEEMYGIATGLMAETKYKEAFERFEYLGDYRDCKEQGKECVYNIALNLMRGNRFAEAKTHLVKIADYKNCTDLITDCKIHGIHQAIVGDIVYFGKYEQGCNEYDPKDMIEWKVLEARHDKVLLISESCLDCKPYDEQYKHVTWESCSLRKWLNTFFLMSAFTGDEIGRIDSKYDKVFLLTIEEAQKYFYANNARKTPGTQYANLRGAFSDAGNDNAVNWWLRNPGQYGAGYVSVDGSVNLLDCNYVNLAYIGVRPVIWVKK